VSFLKQVPRGFTKSVPSLCIFIFMLLSLNEYTEIFTENFQDVQVVFLRVYEISAIQKIYQIEKYYRFQNINMIL